MSSTGGSCQTDVDCPDTRICYNTSWTNGQSVCLCSTWYGFSGADCEQVLQTGTSSFRVTWNIIVIVWWLTILLIGLWDLRKLLKYKGWSWAGWTVTHTCQIQLVIAMILSLIAESFGMASTLTPMALVIYLPGTERKTTPLFYPKQILSNLSYCFIFLALATLPLHWREIANQAFRPNKTKLSYLKPLIVFELLFSVITLIFVALSLPTIAYISTIPFIIVLVALYGFGGIGLWRILTRAATNQQIEQRQRFLKSARNVARTSLVMFVIGLLVMITNLVFGLVGSDPEWREYSRPDQVSFAVVIGTLSSFFLTSAATFGQFYLSTTIRATISRGSSYVDTNSGGKDRVISPIVISSHKNHKEDTAHDQNDEGYSAQPDSIVALSDAKAIKSKRRFLKRKDGPRRLRPITDLTYEATNTTVDGYNNVAGPSSIVDQVIDEESSLNGKPGGAGGSSTSLLGTGGAPNGGSSVSG